MRHHPNRAALCLALCFAIASCGRAAPAAPAATRALVLAPTGAPLPTRLPTSTATPIPTAPPAPTTQIGEYTAYRVKPGDTLERIAAAGGSEPELVLAYNHLMATPQVGCELLLPRRVGQASQLPQGKLLVVHGNTAKPWVALTLDCGNTYGHMGPILDELRSADIRITFFLTGNAVEDSPELVRQMARDGHELAHHSYSHPDFTTLTDGEMLWELRRNELMMREILGPDANLRPYMRFPYGANDARTVAVVIGEGYMPVHWSLDLRDAIGEPKTTEYIVERVMAMPEGEMRGAIILGHCTGAVERALPTLIERLHIAGYEIRTLSDVLGE